MIKAIETEYAGVLFRSKLEAMHAKFFDMHNIPWMYEPFLIENGMGKYLPDFYLPDMDCYFEVKGDGIPGRFKAWSVMGSEYFGKTGNEDKTFFLAFSNGRTIDISYYGFYKNFKEEDQQMEGEYGRTRGMYDEEGNFAKCVKCGKIFLRNEWGSWACGICGHYEGDGGFHHIEFNLPQIRQDWKHSKGIHTMHPL